MSRQSQLLSTILSILLIGCSNHSEHKSAWYESQGAVWITDDRELPTSDSLFYMDNPSPLFRKEFSTTKPVNQAKLYITAAGYYRAFLNGKPIGKNILDPAWTDYSKRIYYSEYNISNLLNGDENCLGVSLGNGFYNPLPLQKWGRRNLREDLTVGKPVFLAKLIIEFEDGTSEVVVSDTTWKYHYGPIQRNSVYLGVKYDAREELNGWEDPGFDDGNWSLAKQGAEPGGQLQETFFPPVRITREIEPIAAYSPQPGIWILDMGVNFTGTYKIKLSGEVGDTITFRFGERVYEDGTLNPMTSVIGQIKREGVGGPGAPDIAWQTDSYIIGDDTPAWFQPDFTYHVFRYMEIRGLDEKPNLKDIKGLSLHSDVGTNNNFSSSSSLLNSIQEVTERTFLANLVSVQSDCPAREKFGYGGDLNATSESFIYNFDMQSFYRKTIYDWVDAMSDTTFVDTAPYTGIKYCGISWESAYLITQYYLYLYYNDTEIIRELYEQDKEWMDKVARIHPEGMVTEGLSDHESMLPVPVGLTGTCHYIQCARIMQEFASVIGDQVNEQKYQQLEDRLVKLVRTKFWDQEITENINRQTLFATLLYHEIIAPDDVPAAQDSLLKAVNNGPSGHFSTGIFGTKYILETLSEHVSPDTVFSIVNSIEYPGWGFMIDNGATTLWETWKESDNTYSNNHPMFGTVTEWYYRWLGGIRPDPEHPGFSAFTLAPSTPAGLDSVNCTYHSPHGAIVSNWKRTKEGDYQYAMTIPEGTMAYVKLSVDDSQKIVLSNQSNQEKLNTEDLKDGQFELDGGIYEFTVSQK